MFPITQAYKLEAAGTACVKQDASMSSSLLELMQIGSFDEPEGDDCIDSEEGKNVDVDDDSDDEGEKSVRGDDFPGEGADAPCSAKEFARFLARSWPCAEVHQPSLSASVVHVWCRSGILPSALTSALAESTPLEDAAAFSLFDFCA
jgi:hypothetical protein